MSFRILLADDHTIVRQAIKSMLEQEGFSVVGEAWDGQQAVQLCSELKPEVAVLDLLMPLLNGIDAAREIVGTCHHTKVVLLTMYTHDRYVFESLQLGVKGYVSKENTSAELVEAIRAVRNGETYISRYVSTAVRNACLTQGNFRAPLSVRERQVLCLLAEGKGAKEIARLLSISEKTVHSHRVNILDKLQVPNTAGLVLYAIRGGLVEGPPVMVSPNARQT